MVHAPRLVLGTHGFLNLRKTIFTGQEIASHKHVLGLTGQGKSKAIAGYVLQLFEQGIPFCLVDPHAELADDVLLLFSERGHFPDGAPHNQIRYVDFSRRDRFLPFNVLNSPYPVDRIAGHLIEVSQRVWPNLAGGGAPTFERLFTNTLKLLVHSALPLTYVTPVLTDKPLREALLAACPCANPPVRKAPLRCLRNGRLCDGRDAGRGLRDLFRLGLAQQRRAVCPLLAVAPA